MALMPVDNLSHLYPASSITSFLDCISFCIKPISYLINNVSVLCDFDYQYIEEKQEKNNE